MAATATCTGCLLFQGGPEYVITGTVHLDAGQAVLDVKGMMFLASQNDPSEETILQSGVVMTNNGGTWTSSAFLPPARTGPFKAIVAMSYSAAVKSSAINV